MTASTRVALTTRAAWLILGAAFTTLTARVLLWDVSSLRELTPDHLLTIGALVGAVASGLYAGKVLRSRKIVPAFGLTLACVGATVYCLIGSAGRADQAAFEKNAEAREHNYARERAQRTLGEAQQRYDAALDAETKECATGRGSRCEAREKTRKERRTDLEVAQRVLDGLGSEQRENGKLKRAAELVAFFGGVERAKAEQGLTLLWPFLPPLICELLSVIFLHLALASAPARAVVLAPANDPDGGMQLAQVAPARLASCKAADRPAAQVVKLPTRRLPLGKDEALAALQDALARRGALPPQETIAGAVGVHPATVSRWLRDWRASGQLAVVVDGRRRRAAG